MQLMPSGQLKQFCFLAGLMMLLGAGSTWAAKVNQLYLAQLLVSEQSVDVTPAQLRAGLSQIIIKVSGRRDSIAHPDIKQAMTHPKTYLRQFSYQSTTIPITTADDREVLAQRLRLELDRKLVDDLLINAGIRPMGTNRPAVLVWIIEERNSHRQYLGSEDDPVLAPMMIRARERGLPLYRPLMDLVDERALPVSDAWGFFQDSILSASARYRSDSVLTGKVYRTQQGGWRSQWQLLWRDRSIKFEAQGIGLEEQLASAVDQAADHLFVDFVEPAQGYDEDGILLQVDRIDSQTDYFRVLDFLKELSASKQVSVYQVDGDQLTFRILIDSTLNQLREMIRLNALLVEQPRALGALEPATRLHYQWQG